jgi:HPt (histidine-containing phosphotransfer) domain-containing protein
MPTPPRRSGKTGKTSKTSGRTGGAPDMMARATAQASRDASALFDQLDDARLDESNIERHADVLERLAKRIRAGVWTVELAQLVAQAQEVEDQLVDE